MRNVSLVLDKRHAPWPAEKNAAYAKGQLQEVCSIPAQSSLLIAALKRVRELWQELGAACFEATTAGPLSLHLSRSPAMENVGLALHPTYGFAWIPGSGLKGLARAYARLDSQATKDSIERVFGRAPETDDEQDAFVSAGSVVFHDAYPEQWPTLRVEILNNHHVAYYEDDGLPPLDVEEPVPVNYLAVAPGTVFLFAVSARGASSPDDVRLAQRWLRGGLQWLGAGAKTNSGHGYFKLAGSPAPEPGNRKVWSATLELVSPAFLAGALQTEPECTLRSSTLRGLLRWWWRALQSARLSVQDLHAWEGLLWGTTEKSGAISLKIVPVATSQTREFDYRTICDGKRLREPTNGGSKWSNSLLYLAYGMQGSRDKKARYYLEPGASWRVEFICRSVAGSRGEVLDAAQVARQAASALGALSFFGGIGAKSRHGFGSVDLQSPTGLEFANASQAIQWCGDLLLSSGEMIWPYSSSVHARNPKNGKAIRLAAGDPWAALHSLGGKLQHFMQANKHQPRKALLGLPRKMAELERMRDAQLPRRFTSPIHFRLVKSGGDYYVRVTAFPTAVPAGMNRSFQSQTGVFEELLRHLGVPKDKP